MPFVIQSGSKQYVVNYGQQVILDKLDVPEGGLVNLDLVFAFGPESGVNALQARVVKHQKGPKIRVVKYKAKSNYHKQYGFRPWQTIVEIVR
jgi:large subunit ribosomal protein L21